MFFLFLVFFVSIIAILFVSHFFLYFSLMRFFSLENYKNSILVILFFLAISFIVSLLLIHWKENDFTRSLYYLSGLWLGFLANIVLSFGVAWITYLTIKFFGFQMRTEILGGTFIFLAILISFWGAWNAKNPVIRNVDVKIANLPQNWQGKKIVQLSDVHLGLANKADFMEKVAKQVNAQNPEMVVITGDLFDGMDENLEMFVSSIDAIETTRGIYFVTGNHETYVGLEKVFEALSKTKVKVLRDEVVDVSGLKLIGLDFPQRDQKRNIVEILEKLKDEYFGNPNVLLYHSPDQINQIKNMGINLELCGHTHKGQIFPFGFLTKIIFHGFDYGLFTQGDYNLYTNPGTGTWGPAMRTEGRSEIVVLTLH